MRSSALLLAVLTFATLEALGGVPASKRTILTSGEIVHPVRYQLGQSTLLFFGFKPETVLCGNKNYFNIEKFKDGITIQPLANFSTNLTVIDGNRRFLFFLLPSGANAPDGFIDVKWVSPQEAQPIPSGKSPSAIVRELKGSAKLSGDFEFRLTQAKHIRGSERVIVEFTIKNVKKLNAELDGVEVLIFASKLPSPGQVTIWEKETAKPGETVSGRTIVTLKAEREVSLVIGYKQKTTKLVLSKGALFSN